MTELAGQGFFRQVDRRKADFLEAGWEDICARRRCDELGAETDAECRPVRFKAASDEVPFGCDEQVNGIFIDTDRATKNDGKIG